ncbi:MAG: hypothetical protein J7M26_06790 [Armatimonadetes bacterium]|nr:hypothetical protein [Armatimonadota bacterium]
MAARIAMIAITTSNSMSVKPLRIMTPSFGDRKKSRRLSLRHLQASPPGSSSCPRPSLAEIYSQADL